jgi:LPXTG-site transpeptidase (sortase) family protein
MFVLFGISCIVIGLFIVLVTFIPLISQEFTYSFHQISNRNLQVTEMVPKDTTMGILIPKIGANASIIRNVDPYDSRIYQQALTRGVAHAKGTVIPSLTGNSFLFSHSSEDLFNANRYNSIFYLLNKLIKGDEIWIYVGGTKFVYSVDTTAIVNADDVKYMNPATSKKQLTLMTCWPPGTNLKRLIVIATIKE